MEMEVQRRRNRGRPKRRWLDSVKGDLRRKVRKETNTETEQGGGGLSKTSTLHRSGKRRKEKEEKEESLDYALTIP